MSTTHAGQTITRDRRTTFDRSDRSTASPLRQTRLPTATRTTRSTATATGTGRTPGPRPGRVRLSSVLGSGDDMSDSSVYSKAEDLRAAAHGAVSRAKGVDAAAADRGAEPGCGTSPAGQTSGHEKGSLPSLRAGRAGAQRRSRLRRARRQPDAAPQRQPALLWGQAADRDHGAGAAGAIQLHNLWVKLWTILATTLRPSGAITRCYKGRQ